MHGICPKHLSGMQSCCALASGLQYPVQYCVMHLLAKLDEQAVSTLSVNISHLVCPIRNAMHSHAFASTVCMHGQHGQPVAQICALPLGSVARMEFDSFVFNYTRSNPRRLPEPSN